MYVLDFRKTILYGKKKKATHLHTTQLRIRTLFSKRHPIVSEQRPLASDGRGDSNNTAHALRRAAVGERRQSPEVAYPGATRKPAPARPPGETKKLQSRRTTPKRPPFDPRWRGGPDGGRLGSLAPLAAALRREKARGELPWSWGGRNRKRGRRRGKEYRSARTRKTNRMVVIQGRWHCW